MKKSRLALAFAGMMLAAVFLSAEKNAFWTARPYTEWTDKEVDKLLKDSPWARTILLSTGPDESAQQRGRGGEESDAGLSTAGNPPFRERPKLAITWYSRTIRQGVARRLLLANPASTEQADHLLNRPPSQFYEILVVGWNPGRNRDQALQALKEQTFLQKKNKEKIPLGDVILPVKRGDPLVLRFAREANGKPVLVLEDKEVMLVLKHGENTTRVPFKLSEMVVRDQLDL